MKAAEIKQRHDLDVWVSSQSARNAMLIAHRAVMRAAPIAFREFLRGDALESEVALLMWRFLLSSSVTDEVGSAFSIPVETTNKLYELGEKTAGKLDIFVFSAAIILAKAINGRNRTESSTEYPATGLGISVGDCVTQAIELTVADDPDLKLERHDDREFGDGFIWREVLQDCLATETGREINFIKLWNDEPSPRLEQDWRLTKFNWPDHWSKFWLRWYQSVLDRTPQNPDLLRDIALIPDGEWGKGETHIAKLIEVIEERHSLLQQIADLKEQNGFATLLSKDFRASDQQRSHNHPPELVDAPVEIRRQTTIIWAALDEAEIELKKLGPDPTVLERTGAALLAASKHLIAYCLSLADIAAKKAAEEIGSTGTRWAIKAGTTWYLVHTQPAQSIGQALLDLAQKVASGG